MRQRTDCRLGVVALLLVACAGAACSPAITAEPDARPWAAPDAEVLPVDAQQFVDAPPVPDAGPPVVFAVVYAHSRDTLYRVNPDTLAVTVIGPFNSGGASLGDFITDIAVDRDGSMIAISFTEVYRVDPMTVATTRIASLDRVFNGLSFVPASAIDPTGEEILIATAEEGTLYQIDKLTGAATAIGEYGGGLGSSGDVVSVAMFGTVATVTRPGFANDWLARIDVTTGAATPIGDTGVTNIFGLGYWKGRVYGFTSGQQFVLIDPATGVATVVPAGGALPSWWGAGVTTIAPIIE